ncbi:hypothetical protein [Sphingopyxis flava]|uniref:Uncharacterized protein n=1 Tax=Sphingopyxis flava TaxID=1507287 RepID=A0A1T4ZW37_9SPHN|nr:hypothetical protein [Sphingopyxis flava]SKB26974.1 hypothetical protein SAMN06295937_1001259 [Sphingopyxis flava]
MNLPVPTCADCGVARFSTKPKKSPYCRRCIGRHTGRSPARRAKCSAAMKAYLADPNALAAHAKRTGDGLRRAIAENPEFAEKRRELGRMIGKTRLGVMNRPAGCPSRILAGRRSGATKLAWCPVEYRDDYRRLVKSQGLKAAEARKVIEDQIAADAARFAATGVLPQSRRNEGAPA